MSHADVIRNKLLREGIVKINLLAEHEVAEILADYHSQFASQGDHNGFYWSMADKNKAISAAANEYLTERVLPKLKEHFGNIQSVVSSFFVKGADGDFINPHQDWTFIDGEPQTFSCTCWIPLVDTDYNSGTLGFVPGSHRLTNYVRASPSVSFPNFSDHQRKIIFENTSYINLKAGEALVFNHRTIHSSSPNKLKAIRPAIGICFAPAEGKMIHYCRNPKTQDTVFKYEVDRDFYNLYNDSKLSELFSKGENIPGYRIVNELGFRALKDEELETLFERESF